MKTDKRLAKAFRFHMENGGYIVGSRALCAIKAARAELRAADLETMGILRFITESDDNALSLYDSRDADDKRTIDGIRNGSIDVYSVSLQMRTSADLEKHSFNLQSCGHGCGWRTEAALGGIEVSSDSRKAARDYLRTIRADLAIEADLDNPPADPLPLPAGVSRCVI